MKTDRVVRILIVDDSATIRGMWNRLLGAEPDFQIVGVANDGIQALVSLKKNEVNLVLLDIEMPEMDGLTALPLILQQNRNVRVIIASSLTSHGSKATIEALTHGASDYICKPSATSLMTSVDTISKDLIKKIRSLQYPAATENNRTIQNSPVSTLRNSTQETSQKKGQARVIVVGSSTGGPNALTQVLKRLTPQFAVPIVIVQHMPAFFITALAESLSRDTKRPCAEIKDGETLVEGRMYICPGDLHAEFVKGPDDSVSLSLNANPPENFCRPAVDPLFRSAARVYGKDLVAVILTGMGEDGKKGCEEIRRNGGWIIAQDQATSVVWGMPGAVAEAGLADAIIPLEGIAEQIQSFSKGSAA